MPLMHIIARKTIREFWERHPDAEDSLRSWHNQVEKENWDTPQQVRENHPNVRMIGRNRAIFNIRGNRYRLVVQIDYMMKRVYVRFVGTHSEYNNIDAREV